jgi:hypothetical protein
MFTTAFPTRAKAVVKSDVVKFSVPSTIYVGGAGTVRVLPWNAEREADTVDFVMAAGAILPVQVKKVLESGTNATSMVRVFS